MGEQETRRAARDELILDVSGHVGTRVFVGSWVLAVPSAHGAVVREVPPDDLPRVWARPSPRVLPPPTAPPLDRRTELDAIEEAIRGGAPVEVSGPAGIGKSTLLRHVARRAGSDSASGRSVVFLSVEGLGVEDVIDRLVDAFYESSDPFKPVGDQQSFLLADLDAVLVLDDAHLSPADVQELLRAVPRGRFVLGSSEPALSGGGARVALGGLPRAEAVRLFDIALGRAPQPAEVPQVEALCDGLAEHPGRILQAAALAREGSASIADLAHRVQPAGGAPAGRAGELVTAADIAALPEAERSVLATLTAFAKVPLEQRHIAALSKTRDVATTLKDLADRALVVSDGIHVSLAGAAGWALGWTFDRERLTMSALEHFTTWAHEHREDHRVVAEASDALLMVMNWASEIRAWLDLFRLVRAVDEAFALAKRWKAWESALHLGLRAATETADREAQAWCLHQLGSRALCVGDHATARRYLKRAARLRRSLGDGAGEAVTRANLRLVPRGGLIGRLTSLPRAPLIAAIPLALGLVLGVFWVARGGPGGGPAPPPSEAVPSSNPVTVGALTFDRSSIDFGNQVVGVQSEAQSVTVSNDGEVALRIGGIVLAGTAPGDFSLDEGCSNTTLDAHDSCTIDVTFTPGQAGLREATLSIDLDGGSTEIPLSGNGTAGAVTPDQTNVDFDDQPLGVASDPRPVTLTNRGTAPVQVDQVNLGGPDAGDFSTDGGCADTELGPDANCTIEVTFTPGQAGQREATLTIQHEGGPTEISLTGNGTAGAITLDRSTIDFGEHVVGTTSDPQAVVVTNTGTARVEDIGVGVQPSGEFGAVDRCASSLEPGSTCTIEVTFTPTQAGILTATLTVSGRDVDSAAVGLTGTGIEESPPPPPPPPLSFDPSPADFGDQPVGSQSGDTVITVTNTGPDDLQLSDVSIGGTDASDFGIDSGDRGAPFADSCLFLTTLSAGGSCEVPVYFLPTAEGERFATLDISYDPGGPQSVSLIGTGILPDLIVTDLTATTVTVMNDGDADAGTFTVDVSGVRLTVVSLAPGEAATLSFSCTEGTLTATADVDGQVAESDEDNNTLSGGPFLC